ncbi:MAG: peptide ABC transporter ATP-binding protein [Phycisphaeraceae bacterium]|nr:peptide ABC transporter ATP-binding protein [Phycisphaeraceae bacterium]
MPDPILQIDDLAVSFPSSRSDRRRGGERVRAVNGVGLSVYPTQTVAVVGESGCGKSVTALSILRLVPTPPGRYDGGRILWSDPSNGGGTVDLLTQTDRQMQEVRGNQIAMIFQEPMTSLNPVYTIGEQIREAVVLHQAPSGAEATRIAIEALGDVGIADPEARLKEYPHQLSGGMRQRVMIAMALACRPNLLLADEPTTALDVTIQAQILELLRELQTRRGMSVMLITHDLGVVAENADVVAVMYAGRVVEYGSVHDVFSAPQHPYTRGLFSSMPVLGMDRHRLTTIPGNVPNPSEFPSGCRFHPRCDDRRDDEKCAREDPDLHEVAPSHWSACWHTEGHDAGKPTRPDVTFRREEPSA